jgi:hypothetical protein
VCGRCSRCGMEGTDEVLQRVDSAGSVCSWHTPWGGVALSAVTSRDLGPCRNADHYCQLASCRRWLLVVPCCCCCTDGL